MNRLRPLLQLEAQRRWARAHARWTHCALGCLLIVLWQGYAAFAPPALESSFQLRASSGVTFQKHFVYFDHYLGLFPLTSLRELDELEYSEDGARAELAGDPRLLASELGDTIREGDWGCLLLYRFDAWLNGPRTPSLRPAAGLAFVAALVGLFVACWWSELPWLGLFLVLLAGSNPFQLTEVYARENVFSWSITSCLALLALYLPLTTRPRRGWLLAAAVLAGLGLASVRQVRSEPAVLLISALAAPLTVSALRWRWRGLALALTLASFLLGGVAWRAYFAAQVEEAHAELRARGGVPFPGRYAAHHTFWHPLWCGLGDFGREHGYAWSDRAAAEFAVARLREKGRDIPPLTLRSTVVLEGSDWAEFPAYPRVPWELPGYAQVLREKIVADARADPTWFLGIYPRRLARLLSHSSPLRLTLGRRYLPIPFSAWLLLPALALLCATRSWLTLRLLAFVAPTAATALVIYSGRGTPLYSLLHLVLAACFAAWGLEAFWRRRGQAEDESDASENEAPAEEATEEPDAA